MSTDVLDWVMRINMPPSMKLVAVVLSRLVDRDGVTQASVPTIAKMAAVSTRSVRRALQKLEFAGCLRVEPCFHSSRAQASSKYHFATNLDPNCFDFLRDGEQDIPISSIDTSAILSGGDIPAAGADKIETSLPNHTLSHFGQTNASTRHALSPPDIACSSSKSFKTTTTTTPMSPPAQLGSIRLDESLPEKIMQVILFELASSSLDPTSAQLVADEFLAALSQGDVKRPTSYLRSLIRRAGSEGFTPDAGLSGLLAEWRRAKPRSTEPPKTATAPKFAPKVADRKPMSEFEPAIRANLNALSEMLGTVDLKF